MPKILFVFGTRPEAVKLCPLILEMRARARQFEVRVAVTGQHREMLDPVLSAFDIAPDYHLGLMRDGQTLTASLARMLAALEPVLAGAKPDLVFVQGDTTSTVAGALCAFYSRIDVAHIEAGLRTGDPGEPFPEEMNRTIAGRLATLHFAATASAAENLLREGVRSDAIFTTGNTGIDAVRIVRHRLASGSLPSCGLSFLDARRKLIVITAHRRESFGSGMEAICRAVRRIANRADIQIVWPVHRNPNVSEIVHAYLGGCPSLHLVEPLPYAAFVDLMRRAYLLLTDSGGIQEEAPALGRPVLVMRGKTERGEGIEIGAARLVGADEARIVTEVEWLLDHPEIAAEMSTAANPYGDGLASRRIADATVDWFAKRRAAVTA